MLFTAIILGFTGSLHCVAMCSPLATAVTQRSTQVWRGRFIYHLGRILTYGLLGLAAASTFSWLPITSYQNIISITLGCVLLIGALAGMRGVRIPGVTPMIISFTNRIKIIFGKQLKQRNAASTFLMGTINGFLPCGLSMMALLFCIAMPTPLYGFIYMILFGVGTLPGMFGLSVFVQHAVTRWHWNVKYVMTALLITAGAALIGRGVLHRHLPEQGATTAEQNITVCR